MNLLTNLANKRNNDIELQLISSQKKVDDNHRDHLRFLESEFTARFSSLFDSFEQMGINWRPMMNDIRYVHQGCYILFTRGEDTLKMDFNNRNSYRYEYYSNSKSHGTITYGDWDLERFADFIIKGLNINL